MIRIPDGQHLPAPLLLCCPVAARLPKLTPSCRPYQEELRLEPDQDCCYSGWFRLQDNESGEDITAQNGRYGPYLKKGTDSRSLESEDQIFSIELPGALEIFAQPKYGARRPSSALKEFEADPVSGKPIKVRDGRFGPYVTDGETNATIPRGEDVEAVDFDRAVQLLADKRAKGPAKKPAKRKPAAKRAPAKKKS